MNGKREGVKKKKESDAQNSPSKMLTLNLTGAVEEYLKKGREKKRKKHTQKTSMERQVARSPNSASFFCYLKMPVKKLLEHCFRRLSRDHVNMYRCSDRMQGEF